MTQRKLTIGSGTQCDIRIDEDGVDEIHALLYLEEDMLCLELLNDNTAIINGNEVMGKFWLQAKDEVAIGQRSLNLSAIVSMLGGNPQQFASSSLDAVQVKRNWWPAILIAAVFVGVGTLFYIKYNDYKRKKEIKQKEMQVQESINQRQNDSIVVLKMKLDSTGKLMENIVNEKSNN